MKATSAKLRELRTALGLSQEYVAHAIGSSRSAVAMIERGGRQDSSDEIAGFARLYQVSADYLVGNEMAVDSQAVFARGFGELSDNDQQEILNLIAFKRSLASR